MNTNEITLIIIKGRVWPVLGRHPWVFSGSIKNIPEWIESWTIVKLTDEWWNYLASWYFNSYSQISVRIWSYDENEKIDQHFFEKRIKTAYELRKNYIEISPEWQWIVTDSYRLINSENDLLPWLIVDKYADYLSIQFHTEWIEKYKEFIVNALVDTMKSKWIYERSDFNSKKIDNTEKKWLIYWEIPEFVKIKENWFNFLVNIIEWQKTWFFLDQRDKRQAIMKYSKWKNVLNCFSYTWWFSVYALWAWASNITSIDISEKAVNLSKENMQINNLPMDKCEFIAWDVKNYLKGLNVETPRGASLPGKTSLPDVIILDPPAFIKDRKKKKEGIWWYKTINELAMKIIPKNGILVTCSCSHHLTKEEFEQIILESAAKAKRSVQILEYFTHWIDHNRLISFREWEYLKTIFLRVL